MRAYSVSEHLVRQLLGWKVAPDRFIKSGRSWIPKWRFNPLERLEDAFLLLDHANATYTLSVGSDRVFVAEVRISNQIGKATGQAKARTITLAIALALGIETERR